MAYSLTSQAYGASLANAPVRVLEASTGTPATILASASGGLISTDGRTSTDASGNLNIYLDNSRTWSISVDDQVTVVRPLSPGYSEGQLSSGVKSLLGSNIQDATVIFTSITPTANDGRPEGTIYVYTPD